MTNTIDNPNRTNPFSLGFVKILLRGAGQVMFQNSAWTGLLFLIGIFWGAYAERAGAVAWGALLAVAVSTLTGYLLNLPARDGEQGLWGFNGILVGCAFPSFLGNTVWMWLALVLCAALTTWVRTGFNQAMLRWKINSLTFPFVFCTWFFLLAARAMHGLPAAHMSDPSLPEAFSAAVDLRFGSLVVYWLKGIAQVFLIDSWVTGLLFLAGLFVCNRRAALWAAIGSALALLTVIALQASGAKIAGGLYGYSPVLTAIALATVFYKPNRRSAVWAVLGILVTVFVQAGMYVLLAPLGIATLTAPFCIATWLFLLPLIQFDDTPKPDHSNWDPENKRHLPASEQRPFAFAGPSHAPEQRSAAGPRSTERVPSRERQAEAPRNAASVTPENAAETSAQRRQRIRTTPDAPSKGRSAQPKRAPRN